MFKVKNFMSNQNIIRGEAGGPFTVMEYKKDMSVTPDTARTAFYMGEMGVRKRQVTCELKKANGGVTLQAGAMQWMLGNVQMTTGIKRAGDLISKAVGARVSKESAIKPEYTGSGLLVLEPTYKFILIEDIASWNGGVVLEDGLFLACESSLTHKIVARSNFSSAIGGGEGLFNLSLSGSGFAVLESPCPREELVEITLDNDTVKIDGPYAIAWSKSLEFTVERSSRSLIGSAASGEGLVNVYRGTGKVLMRPI